MVEIERLHEHLLPKAQDVPAVGPESPDPGDDFLLGAHGHWHSFLKVLPVVAGSPRPMLARLPVTRWGLVCGPAYA